jgi:DNA-binding XRE family transcriptional regulator
MRIWLKEARKNKRLIQKSVAQSAEISRSCYALIENGSRRPSVKTAKKIAEVLNFDWTLFFEDIIKDTAS